MFYQNVVRGAKKSTPILEQPIHKDSDEVKYTGNCIRFIFVSHKNADHIILPHAKSISE